MPSQTFLLTRPDGDAAELLPTYSSAPETATRPPAYVHGKKLSTILESANDDDDDENHGASHCITVDAEDVASSSAFARQFAKMLSLEYATMLPQALLVDASSTLCAYLYFTSLQARMVIQQQASLDILQTVCSAAASTNPTTALVSLCGQAVEHSERIRDAIIPAFVSHKLVIASVAAKALLGYALLRFFPRHIRPFDFLVASGAAHCMMLYCFFFLPIADALEGIALSESSVWLHLANKFFWVILVLAALAFVHRLFVICFSSCGSSGDGRIALTHDDADHLLAINLADEKDLSLLV